MREMIGRRNAVPHRPTKPEEVALDERPTDVSPQEKGRWLDGELATITIGQVAALIAIAATLVLANVAMQSPNAWSALMPTVLAVASALFALVVIQLTASRRICYRAWIARPLLLRKFVTWSMIIAGTALGIMRMSPLPLLAAAALIVAYYYLIPRSWWRGVDRNPPPPPPPSEPVVHYERERREAIAA